MKQIAGIAAAIAAAALLAGAVPAMAIGGASLAASPATVYQGSTTYLSTDCGGVRVDFAALSTSWGLVQIVPSHGTVQLNIGKTFTPGKYTIALLCSRSGKYVAQVNTQITVEKWVKPTPPPTPPAPKPTPHSRGTVVISTGFGGMASAVASHHPAS